jgi:hypothetical protein
MNTGLGGWMGISRHLAKYLPRDRPYTELEAMYSLQLDYWENNDASVAGYAEVWMWSRTRVRTFLSNVSAEINGSKGRFLLGKISPTKRTGTDTGTEQEGRQVQDRYKTGTRQVRMININDLGDQDGQVQGWCNAGTDQVLVQVQSRILDTTIERDIEKERDVTTTTLTPQGEAGEREEEADSQQQLDKPESVSDDAPEKPGPPSCPHQKIIDLYHQILCPPLPKVQRWTESRGKHLKARWVETKESSNIEWWEGYFKLVKKCPWLMGEIEPSSGGKRFVADIDWLINPNNMAKVLEGKYSQDGARRSLFDAPRGAAVPPRTCPIGTTAFGIISTENGETDGQ